MKRLLRRRARPKCDCEYQSAFGPCADLHLRRPALVIQRGARLTRGAPPAGSSHMSLITGTSLPLIVVIVAEEAAQA
jgi:hypothetical protein